MTDLAIPKNLVEQLCISTREIAQDEIARRPGLDEGTVVHILTKLRDSEVGRGGSFDFNEDYARCSFRLPDIFNYKWYFDIGCWVGCCSLNTKGTRSTKSTKGRRARREQ